MTVSLQPDVARKEKMVMCWSGGKDSALALYELQKARRYEISALLTTVTKGYDRISMHGVREALLKRQAASLGLKLHQICISKGASNEEYESEMEKALKACQESRVDTVGFGDIFLEDLRAYREKNLTQVGMRGIFPIWKRDTKELANTFIELGFKAIVVCVDNRVLDPSFSGKLFDKDFLRRLPSHIDPCGENGEFHSFVYAGPIFRQLVDFSVGNVVVRDTHFCFCDLVP